MLLSSTFFILPLAVFASPLSSRSELYSELFPQSTRGERMFPLLPLFGPTTLLRPRRVLSTCALRRLTLSMNATETI
ncbi:hypothetical protein BT96DRAFT_1010592 [Gymnopus androsaceus JB14]|uniref:Secreted protein n=1 Tax=Gymnopus androsaceus JB14 TaxID=1447944 RepID=A0A6A4GAF6_9AGAR|nr:hypothetical protein BT96DRAFT_1010592 [Gymnopus androsaceus JB14]